MFILNIGLDHPTRGPARQLYDVLKVLRNWDVPSRAERVDGERTFVIYTERNCPPEHLALIAQEIGQDSIAYWNCMTGTGGLSGPNPSAYEPFDKAKFIF